MRREGAVTFTAVSGTAKRAKRVDCTQPMTNRFDFTTAGPSLAIQADSPRQKGWEPPMWCATSSDRPGYE